MNNHKTAAREEWLAARMKLLEAGKALTRRSYEQKILSQLQQMSVER
ncbi:MAG TPA: hypothetical protein VFX43_11060 [Chitinophagaceae bacterium]|jgi:predicted dithiol-disulfide oxidoreductase (DUF899 family)|nr:hypothetical protein [Chitinophagaceae bacterium]